MANNNNLELLLAVCAAMQETGLVTSKAEFSTRILGRSPSYLSSMATRNRYVDDGTITGMKEVIEAWLETPDPNRPCPVKDLLAIYIMICARENRGTSQAVSRISKDGGSRRGSASRWWGKAGAQIRARVLGR